jgi:hypothetical protein
MRRYRPGNDDPHSNRIRRVLRGGRQHPGIRGQRRDHRPIPSLSNYSGFVTAMDIIHLSKVSRTTGPEVWHDYNQYRREKLHQNPWDYSRVVTLPNALLKKRRYR